MMLVLACFVTSVGAADTRGIAKSAIQGQTKVAGFFPTATNPAAPYQRTTQPPRGTTDLERGSLLNRERPELRTLFWNCDGTKEKGVALETALKAQASIVLLTDTRSDSHGTNWEHTVRKVWGKNCFVRSCPGLERFDGSRIGGCAVAVRGGWVNRCKGVISDQRGWGRYLVLKLSGSTNIWLTICYFAYLNNDRESSSYMEMQRKAMDDIDNDKASNEHMPVTDGKYDSQKLLCRDLEELKLQAEAHGAEIVIAGDFNEQYLHGTDRRLHNWMDNVMHMKNVLHNGNETGNETCFSKEGGTDIDWICTTQKIADPRKHRCWIHEFSIGGMHRPTFMECKAVEIMNLSKDDIQTYSAKKVVADPLGTRNKSRIANFNAKLNEAWGNNNVEKLLDDANNGKSAKAMEAAYEAVTHSFASAINWTRRHYLTGDRRKTYYSLENLQVGKFLKTVGRLRTYWLRRLNSGTPFDHNPYRGQSRNGKHFGGKPVTLSEHKTRLIALATQISEHDFAGKQVSPNKAGKMVHAEGRVLLVCSRSILTHPSEADVEDQLDVWERTMRSLNAIESLLKKLHSSKARLYNVKQAQRSVELRHENWTARRLRGWFSAVREKQSKGGPIFSVLKGGELISEPTELATYVQDFFEDWFGKNRRMWYHNDDGGVHPFAADDKRGAQLREAFVNGSYHEIAKGNEQLPECATRFQNVSTWKNITRGPDKGCKVTDKYYHGCDLPYSADELKTARQGMNMTKRPGMSGVSKRALFHANDKFWDGCCRLMNMSKETGHVYEQFKIALLVLLEKVPGDPSLKNRRPLFMLEDLMKAMDKMDEARVQKVMSELGLSAKGQYGFTKNESIRTPIFITTQMIEQSRLTKKELRVIFSDYKRAFDAVDRCTGKLLAKMRLGIPQSTCLRERERDEAIEGELEIAAGLCSKFTGSRMRRVAGWSQGGARAGAEWKRCIDVNMCAHEEHHDGTPATYIDEWGTYTEYHGHWYADDPTIFCGDAENVEARVSTDELWSKFAGVPIGAEKGHYLAMIFDKNGKMVEHDDHTVHITNCQSGVRNVIPHLGNDEPVRTLGFHLAGSIATDQSFTTACPICQTELDVLLRKALTADEFAGIINLCVIPRIKLWFCYSTTSDNALRKLQSKYKAHLKRLAHLPSSFPNNLLFGAPERGGIGISCFADEVNVSRVLAFFQHIRGNATERELACSAVKSSEMLTQEDIPVMERIGPRWIEHEWDQTWNGRIAEFCIRKGFQIKGGQHNRGHREGDITIMSLFNQVNKITHRRLLAGCRHFNLHWVSQLLSEDSSTFKTTFQNDKQLFSGKYEVHNYSEDCFGNRVERVCSAESKQWVNEVKNAVRHYGEICVFGDYRQGRMRKIAACDVVLIAGDSSMTPKIVIATSESERKIKVLNTSSDLRPNAYKHTDAKSRKWQDYGLRSTMSTAIYSVDAETQVEVHDLAKAIPVETQFLPRKDRATVFFALREEDFLKNGAFIMGGIFFRFAIDVEWFHKQCMRQCESELHQYYLPDQTETYRHILGERNIMSHLPRVSEIAASLKEQCSHYQHGAVLTGGDASGTRAHTESKCSHCFAVFGVGESSPVWWDRRHASDVKVMACGGSIDWISPMQQSSGRSEVICILTAMLTFRGLGIDVLHSTDYLYARNAVKEVQRWSATEWCNCTNRDLWESIAYLLDEYKAAGTSFRVFHNKAHPENWKSEISDYSALEMVAHLTDSIAAIVKEEVVDRPLVPTLPGRNRWRLMHGGNEVIGPMSKTMQHINRMSYIAQHFATSRNGTIGQLDPLTFWPAIESELMSNKTLTSRVAVAKFLYQWWATNAKLAQRKQLDAEDADAECCECGQVESAHHILCECTCERYVNVRRAFASQRAKIIASSPYSSAVKSTFCEIHELKSDGTYPDLSSESVLWQDDHAPDSEANVILDYQKGGSCPLPWFTKGPLPSCLVNSAAATLNVEYDEAFRFCKKWFKSALDEGLMIWRARNLHKHNGNLEDCISYADLRHDYFAAVRYLNEIGVDLPDKTALRTMRREGMQKYIDKADDARASNSMMPFVTVNGKQLTCEEMRARQRDHRRQQRL